MSDQNCPVCEAAQSKTIAFPKPKNALFTGLEICLCRGCGMGWVTKHLDPAQLHDYYAQDYAQHAKRDKRAGPQDYFADPEKMFKPQRSRAQLRLAETVLSGPPQRVLDLGAGFGTTLHLARSEFWPQAELIAVEPDLSMKPYLDHIGARIIASLDEAPEGSCDLIVASHVLEHYQSGEIHELLRRLRSRLAPGGVIVAEVPNSDFLAYPGIVDHSHEPHLLFFSQKAFGDLFAATGFAVSFISTTGAQRRRGALADLGEKLRRRIKGKSEYGPHRSAIRLVAGAAPARAS